MKGADGVARAIEWFGDVLLHGLPFRPAKGDADTCHFLVDGGERFGETDASLGDPAQRVVARDVELRLDAIPACRKLTEFRLCSGAELAALRTEIRKPLPSDGCCRPKRDDFAPPCRASWHDCVLQT